MYKLTAINKYKTTVEMRNTSYEAIRELENKLKAMEFDVTIEYTKIDV